MFLESRWQSGNVSCPSARLGWESNTMHEVTAFGPDGEQMTWMRCPFAVEWGAPYDLLGPMIRKDVVHCVYLPHDFIHILRTNAFPSC